MLGADPQAALLRALDRLPPDQRLLLHVLCVQPKPTSDQIGAALNMPISEIGPARAHALRQLRRILAAADVPR